MAKTKWRSGKIPEDAEYLTYLGEINESSTAMMPLVWEPSAKLLVLKSLMVTMSFDKCGIFAPAADGDKAVDLIQ